MRSRQDLLSALVVAGIGVGSLSSALVSPADALAQPSTPAAGSPSSSSSVPDEVRALVPLAAQELQRGSEILFKGRGAGRFDEASTMLTAAIDRLSPYGDVLDADGRAVLARALDYRAQCRFLKGQEAEAEADFVLLVAAEPSYSPDPTNTSRKILERFQKIQTARVAYVTIQADPQEMEIIWNGRRLGSSLPPDLPVIAGPYVLKAKRDCFGPVEIDGTLGPGEKRIVPVRLDPVARGIRFETRPAGFDVELDGTIVGRTARTEAAQPGEAQEPPGALVVSCVAAGEHRYVLRRDCFEEAKGTVSVEIDFVDRSPIAFPRISPVRQEVFLTVESDVPGSLVRVEGAPIGTVPVKDFGLCPGRRSVEVRSGPRLVFKEAIEFKGSGKVRIAANRRPLLRAYVVDRAERHGREALDATAAARIRERVRSLRGFNVDEARDDQLTTDSKAIAESLGGQGGGGGDGSGADLALLVGRTETERGPGVRLSLITPIGQVETRDCSEEDGPCVEAFFAGLQGPWPATELQSGLSVVPSVSRPGLRVVSARAGATGAGVKTGDLIVEADGRKVEIQSDLIAALDAAVGDVVPVTIERGGSRVEVKLPVRWAPRIAPPGSAPVPVARILATASYEISILPPGEARNAALLNLASVLIGRGEYRRALDLALERSGWADGVAGAAAAGSGRYLAGRCYESLDDSERALAAYRKASEDAIATFWEPDGLPVAPLARVKALSLSPAAR